LLAAIGLVTMSLCALAGDPVVLEGPAESTKAELDQCASALAKRFAVFGLKGLKAVAVEKDGKVTVEVKSSAEIDADTRARIEKFAMFAGQKGAFKLSRDVTQEEKDKGFGPGKTGELASAKSPPGTLWTFCLNQELKPTKEGFVILLKDSPSWTWSEVSVDSKAGEEWTFKLSAAATRRMQSEFTHDVPGKSVPYGLARIGFDALSIVDEVKITLSVNKAPLKEGNFKLPVALAEYLEPILRFPMPRALKRPGSDK
jgi:hypothetical protein